MAKQKRAAWQTLERDANGRFLPRGSKADSKSSKLYKQQSKTKAKSTRDTPKEKEVTKVLNSIKKDFQGSCPRCAGAMAEHWIRCGPEKLVKVNKCGICNFWLPAPEST